MKLVICSALLLMGVTFSALAQKEQKTPEQKSQKVVDWMKTNIGLKPDQETKVYSTVLASIQEMKKVKEQYANQADSLKQKRKVVMEKRKADLKAILSPEQWQQLELKKKELKKKRGQKGPKKNSKSTDGTSPESVDDIELF